jgi:D-serine deaminase-like pyridoxal phosphate-dependent protein
VDWKALLADERLPAAIVDLDALDRNVGRLLAAIGTADVTLRIASKSVRVPWLLRHALALDPRLRGIMAFSAHEATLLADRGFDDLLIAYPPGRKDEADAIAALAARGLRVYPVIDDVAHVALLDAAAKAAHTTIQACVDVDASWRPMGAHVGVRRSPIRGPEAAVALHRTTAGTAVRIGAVMAYEAQVAGLPDRVPGQRLMDLARGVIKSRSRPHVAALRIAVVAALRDAGADVVLVNGGGTGSVASTASDGSCTEVTIGSGLLCSHLFDGYAGLALEPAGFFALAVVRRSDPGFVTCFGGGIVASGSTGVDRLPKVHWPPGLTPLGMEGFGEVQTPFRVNGGTKLEIGDPVICRPAKAGEWLERFDEVLIVKGGAIIARERTYRGLAWSTPRSG